MMAMTRDQLRPALIQHGEEPPRTWTKLELRQRLAEVAEEGIKFGSKKKERTTLGEKVKELNQAAKKKETLKQHLLAQGLELTGNETSAVLQHMGLRHYMETIPPEGGDNVGFGKHSSSTYQELRDQDPGYCRWVKTTATEEKGADPRLQRLAKWLEAAENEELVKPTRGYPKEKKVMNEPGQASQATAAASKGPLTPEMQMMQTMLQKMEKMQEEILDLKEERPRKKNDRFRAPEPEDGQATDSSFQMVREP